jgi:hypothetical protein
MEPEMDILPTHVRALLNAYESVAQSRKLSHRERAGYENEIWCAIPNDVKVKVNQKKGAGLDLGEFVRIFAPFLKPLSVRHRRSLFVAGDATEALWKAVDAEQEPMPLSTAERIWQKARTIAASTGHTPVESVAIAISEYERMPKVVRSDGTVIRKPQTATQRAVAVATGSVATKLKPRTPGKRGKRNLTKGREVIGDLRATLSEYLVQRAVEVGADPTSAVVAEALSSLAIEIDVLQRGLTLAVKRIAETVKSDTVAGVMVSTRKVNQAFRTLNLEPPGRGDEIDMDLVRQHKRRLARQYHPDTHGGKTDTVEKYEAVIEAFDVIESWVAHNPGLVKGK